MQTQAVGVAGQAFAAHQHVLFVCPGYEVRAQQWQLPGLPDVLDGGRDLVRVDGVRLVTGQPEQNRGVRAVPDASG